jgi:multidrug efflux pump subunit AcrA (membrane-fusion protein)
MSGSELLPNFVCKVWRGPSPVYRRVFVRLVRIVEKLIPVLSLAALASPVAAADRSPYDNKLVENLHKEAKLIRDYNFRVTVLPSLSGFRDAVLRGELDGRFVIDLPRSDAAATVNVNVNSLSDVTVPKTERLQAEVLLRNKDVGFVTKGQVVRLKVAAFPFQKYGLIDGSIAMLSADSTDPKQVQPGQAPALTYRALVSLNKEVLTSATSQEKFPISSGMLVSAEIHQGQRTVIEYLLSPVQKVGQESARER